MITDYITFNCIERTLSIPNKKNMDSISTYKNYNSKKDIWDADEKARDTRNYTTPEPALESLNHILTRYLKLKDFNIDCRKSCLNYTMG